MGAEATCKATWQGRSAEGKAYLETDQLLFRGPFRVALPLKDIGSVRAKQGRLVVATKDGDLVLELGPRAEAWAQAILNPKTRAQKLGIKPGDRVAVVGLRDAAFRAEAKEAGGLFVNDPASADRVFCETRDKKDLAHVEGIARSLGPAAALWIVYPKGQPWIREADVLAAGRAAGLVDVKVVRFDDDRTALKFTRRRR